jgi:hypothetical protein
MRVYLPATLPMLRDVLASGEIGPAPLNAFAVTPTLREWYAEGDLEELEYAALTDAARASLRLLDSQPDAPRRRVVLAADVADSAASPAPDLERAVVRLSVAVLLSTVVSAHVDAEGAEDDIREAADAIAFADGGDPDARFRVDGAEGHELLWYAVQEIPDLLA